MERITISRAESLPLTEQELQLWCRIDDVGDESALLEGLILAARDAAEAHTGRVLTDSTVEYLFDSPAPHYQIPSGPVRAITKVETEALDGTRTLLVAGTDYKKRITDHVSVVRLLSPCADPTVVITVTVGYQTAEEIPQPIKQAIAVHAAAAYRGREGQDGSQETFERLLSSYRLGLL